MSSLPVVVRTHRLARLGPTGPAGWWAAECRCGETFAARDATTAARGQSDHLARLAYRAGAAASAP
jgi:hypothetical protein